MADFEVHPVGTFAALAAAEQSSQSPSHPAESVDVKLEAFRKYKKSGIYANATRWAEMPNHVDGSLWSAFDQGWVSAMENLTAEVTILRELLNGIYMNVDMMIAGRDPVTGDLLFSTDNTRLLYDIRDEIVKLDSGNPKPTTCEWFDDDDGWHSGCGHEWEFTYDGPTENSVKFCMYCSKPVAIAEFIDVPESL